MVNQLEKIQEEFKYSLFSDSIGLELSEVCEGHIKITLPYRKSFENMQETIHGGIYATILDTTMGLTCRTLGYDAAITIHMSIQFIRPVREEAIYCTASVISANSKTMLVEGRLFDQKDNLVAHSTGTFRVIKDKSAHDTN